MAAHQPVRAGVKEVDYASSESEDIDMQREYDDEEDDADEEDEVYGPPINPEEDEKFDVRLRNVSKALKNVAPPGGFFASGEWKLFPQPMISVHGIGDVVPPLASSVMKELVAHCHLAPYGHGEKTLVDTQVRNTWELSADQFQLTNPAWCKFVQDQILPSIRTPLGVNAGVQVEAKLYKMLLYEAGGKFKKHQDSEKEDGMFGTLVVVLPGRFAGGELVVHDPSTAPETSSTTTITENNTKTHVWDAGSIDPFAIKFAAFYGDCPHEVKPVTSGYRLCLTYNLVNVGGSDSVPRFGGNHTLYAALKETLCEFFTSDDVGQVKRQRVDTEGAQRTSGFDLREPDTHRQCKFIYVLDHKYTQAGLSFEYLKNKDVLVAASLARFCDESGGAMELYLSKIKYELSWRGPESRSYSRKIKDSFVDTSLHLLSPWISRSDKKIVKIAGRKVYRHIEGDLVSEVAPVGMFDSKSLPFDSKNEQLYTGNAGAQTDMWYKSAALVVVPLAISMRARLEAAPKATLTHWATLVETNPSLGRSAMSAFFEAFVDDCLSGKSGRKALEAAHRLGSLRAVHCVLTSCNCIGFLPTLREVVAPFDSDAVLTMAKSIDRAWKNKDVVLSRVCLVTSLLDGVTDPSVIKPMLDTILIKPFPLERDPGGSMWDDDVDVYGRTLVLAARVSVQHAHALVADKASSDFVKYIGAPAVRAMAALGAGLDPDVVRSIVNYTIDQLIATKTRTTLIQKELKALRELLAKMD